MITTCKYSSLQTDVDMDLLIIQLAKITRDTLKHFHVEAN